MIVLLLVMLDELLSVLWVKDVDVSNLDDGALLIQFENVLKVCFAGDFSCLRVKLDNDSLAGLYLL